MGDAADRRTEDFDQTRLSEPIKVRWTGKLRGRVNERLGAYTSDPSNKSYDEHTVSVWRTLSRHEINVVIETVEEAEYFIKEMERYATVDIHWMNGPMRRCAERVRREVRNGLEEKRPEKETPVSDGWGLDDLDQESRNAIFDAIYDVSDRWGVTIDEAEVFLESAGYFRFHEDDDGLVTDGGINVGPIIFANKYARGQLVEYGEVITFRGDRTVGKTWWTDKYGTSKNGDCTVERIGEIDPTTDALDRYQPLSGFPTTSDWLDAIAELHGSGTESGCLYRVTERDPNE